MSVLTRVDTLKTGRTPFVLATVVRAERPTSAKPGDRALVLPDGTMEGFVGGSCAESTVRSHGLRLLASGESTLNPTSFLRGPSALAFSTASRPRNAMSVFSLHANSRPASTGFSLGVSSRPNAR